MSEVIIKNSNIEGKGVFANKEFKTGEVVVKYSPIKISKENFQKLSQKEKESTFLIDGGYMKHTSPAIYVNHSCDPNTNPSKEGDIAIKNIKIGEEITSDYSKDSSELKMKCNCGTKNCRKIIKLK